MREVSSEQTAQTRESASVTSPVLVHEQRRETLAEHTQHLVSIPETDNSGNDTTGDKLLREARVLTWGVGGAFGDVVTDPLSKLPEAATAGVFGVGLRTLERAGTKGKVLAGIAGAGMFAKMGYDEWSGQRWSEFGGAMSAAWESKANFYDSVQATKHSVGSLAVDMTVGAAAFKAAGVFDPLAPRSNLFAKGETGLSLGNPSRSLSEFTEFSRMGERTSRALGEPPPALRMISKPPPVSEFSLMGERCANALNGMSGRHSPSGSSSLDAVRARSSSPFSLASQDLTSFVDQGFVPRTNQFVSTRGPLDSGLLRESKQATIAPHDQLLLRESIAQTPKSPEPPVDRVPPSPPNGQPKSLEHANRVSQPENGTKLASPVDNVAPPHSVTLSDALKSKLLTEHVMDEFGYMSAIREVAAIETAPGFVADRASYQAIAESVESLARLADPDFAHHYHAVAELVKEHALSLKN